MSPVRRMAPTNSKGGVPHAAIVTEAVASQAEAGLWPVSAGLEEVGSQGCSVRNWSSELRPVDVPSYHI